MGKEFTPTARADSPPVPVAYLLLLRLRHAAPRGQHAADAAVLCTGDENRVPQALRPQICGIPLHRHLPVGVRNHADDPRAARRTVHPVVQFLLHADAARLHLYGIRIPETVRAEEERRRPAHAAGERTAICLCIFAALGLLTLSLGIYYLVAPENSRRSSISATGTPGQNRSKGRSREKAR